MELNAPAIINSCVGIMLLKNLTLIRDTEINLTLTRAAANTAKRVVSSWVQLRVNDQGHGRALAHPSGPPC